MTPHDGEAVRLAAICGTDPELLKKDRRAFAAALAAAISAVWNILLERLRGGGGHELDR